MQDGKALQGGTSHYLGQNFAKAFDIKFLGRDQQQAVRLDDELGREHAADRRADHGPQRRRGAGAAAARGAGRRGDRADLQERRRTRRRCAAFIDKLVAGARRTAATRSRSRRHGIETLPLRPATEQRIVADFRDARPGDKQYHWEQRGVPFRIEVGPRDVDAGAFVLKSRLDGSKETVKLDDVTRRLAPRQARRGARRRCSTRPGSSARTTPATPSTYDEMKQILKEQGGFVRCYFKPDRADERGSRKRPRRPCACIPFDQPEAPGKSIYTGDETKTQVLFAQAY